MCVRDALEELVNQILNYGGFLSHRGWADLFMVSDNNDVVTQVKCNESHHVALTGFIDNHYIKARFPWIKVLDHSGEGHDPDRNGAPTLRHFVCRLHTQPRRTYTCALADLPYGVEPADERLPLGKRSSSRLKHPCEVVNEIDRCSLHLGGCSFDEALKLIDRHAGATVQFALNLAPRPGLRWVSRHVGARVRNAAGSNRLGPSRRSRLKPGQENIPALQVPPEFVQFE